MLSMCHHVLPTYSNRTDLVLGLSQSMVTSWNGRQCLGGQADGEAGGGTLSYHVWQKIPNRFKAWAHFVRELVSCFSFLRSCAGLQGTLEGQEKHQSLAVKQHNVDLALHLDVGDSILHFWDLDFLWTNHQMALGQDLESQQCRTRVTWVSGILKELLKRVSYMP